MQRIASHRTPSQAAYLCLTQLLDYKHELVLLLVNTLLSDLKSDNFVVVCTALVVTSKLIGPDLINAGVTDVCVTCV
jgi:AP-4 complex subunit epsilon-1